MTKNTQHATATKRQPQRPPVRAKIGRALVGVAAQVAVRKLASIQAGAAKTLTTVRAKVVKGAKSTDTAVRAHPYKALGIAAGVGVVAGALLTRRASKRN